MIRQGLVLWYNYNENYFVENSLVDAIIQKNFRVLAILLLIFLVGGFLFVLQNVFADDPLYAGGTGVEGDPYQIETCVQLQNINQNLSSYFVLNNDIDCSDTINWNDGLGFEPIGTLLAPFNGRVDGDDGVADPINYGDGFTINDLYINRIDLLDVGLFGSVQSLGVITDLGLIDVEIAGFHKTGALVGRN